MDAGEVIHGFVEVDARLMEDWLLGCMKHVLKRGFWQG
jgi:hypothetical protein